MLDPRHPVDLLTLPLDVSLIFYFSPSPFMRCTHTEHQAPSACISQNEAHQKPRIVRMHLDASQRPDASQRISATRVCPIQGDQKRPNAYKCTMQTTNDKRRKIYFDVFGWLMAQMGRWSMEQWDGRRAYMSRPLYDARRISFCDWCIVWWLYSVLSKYTLYRSLCDWSPGPRVHSVALS